MKPIGNEAVLPPPVVSTNKSGSVRTTDSMGSSETTVNIQKSRGFEIMSPMDFEGVRLTLQNFGTPQMTYPSESPKKKKEKVREAEIGQAPTSPTKSYLTQYPVAKGQQKKQDQKQG